MSTPRTVSFPSNGIKVAGHLYIPPASAPERKHAAIVVGHPYTGVKEQTSGLYARILAQAGFIALAFDAAYQGESEGEPRGWEDPYQRVEDVKSAVTYLSTLSEVDPERIGALGVCASGGYVPFAAQTDVRIKAVATVSAACLGAFMREGIKNTGGELPRSMVQDNLKKAGQLRIAEAKGEAPAVQDTFPFTPGEVPSFMPPMMTEGTEYYKTKRGQHPRSTGVMVTRCVDLTVNYDSFHFMDLISPRPLLMIAGSDADTRYFSELGIERAQEPKELFIVDGKTHIGLYDHTDVSAPKLVDFFSKSIGV